MKNKNIIITKLLTLSILLISNPCQVYAQESNQITSQIISQQSNKLTMTDLFNYNDYIEMYPDIVAILGNDPKVVINHFITKGIYEGRQPSKQFNIYAYKSSYQDLQQAYGTNILKYYEHYLNIGYAEGRELTTIEKANKAGITVTDFNGNIIGKDLSQKQKQNTQSSNQNIKNTNHVHKFANEELHIGNYSFTDGYIIKYCECGAFQINPIRK